MPQVVSDHVLDAHIRRTIIDIANQVGHAQKVQTTARTGYYRIAIILAASIVEAVLHEYIKQQIDLKPELCKKVQRSELKGVFQLPKNELRSRLGVDRDLWVAEKTLADFSLERAPLLSEMNDFCYKTGLISRGLRNRIRYVRDKRNQIHLQGITTKERKFDSKMLDRVSGVIDTLIDRI